MKVDESGWKWIKVDESGWKWVKVDESEWMRMDANSYDQQLLDFNVKSVFFPKLPDNLTLLNIVLKEPEN